MTKQPVVPGAFDIEDGNHTLAVGNVTFETLPFKSVGLIIEEKTSREEMAAKQTVFQPAFNNSDAYFASASATLARPVFKRLSLMVTTMDNFLNHPAPGFQKNSYQFSTGALYTLR